MSTISGLSSSDLQSILSTSLQTSGKNSNFLNTIESSALDQQADSGRLSPFAQLISRLQRLQQSDPAKYQDVTKQIAANLQSAAETAQSQGNTTAATEFNQLATDFSDASSRGQLPNLQDLARAVSGGHHRHHHRAHAAKTADSSSSANDASQILNQLLSSIQQAGAISDTLNPMNIILKTLSDAGLDATDTSTGKTAAT